MSLLNIQDPASDRQFNIFVLGFRPFFLAAGIFSAASMFMWMLVYHFGLSLELNQLSSFHWHAHEMIYGFSLAVAAGFLLTAIKNWTGVQTLQNTGLAMLLGLWLGARICFLFGTQWALVAAALDLSFNLVLIVAVLQPIIRVKQWKQIGIASKIILMGVFNALFYLGLFNQLDMGIYWGIFGGFFIIIALIMTMGRRVLPFFIEKGVGYPVNLKNYKWLDISSLVLFLIFTISEVFLFNVQLSALMAGALTIVSVLRLINWYKHGIWQLPLVWGLYLAFIFMTLGFLFYALVPYVSFITTSIALHTLALGGIGLITVSMMCRVTLGHTGRSITEHSRWISPILWLLALGTLIRVVFPMIAPQFYSYIIGASQLLWIIAFTLFVSVNMPMLIRPRVDGNSG